jgi:hypothetical protein
MLLTDTQDPVGVSCSAACASLPPARLAVALAAIARGSAIWLLMLCSWCAHAVLMLCSRIMQMSRMLDAEFERRHR